MNRARDTQMVVSHTESFPPFPPISFAGLTADIGDQRILPVPQRPASAPGGGGGGGGGWLPPSFSNPPTPHPPAPTPPSIQQPILSARTMEDAATPFEHLLYDHRRVMGIRRREEGVQKLLPK